MHPIFYAQNRTVVTGPPDPSTTMFGYLYNGYSLDRIAASGWHVPSSSEYNTMITYLGGASVAGGKLRITGTVHWNGGAGYQTPSNSAKWNGKGGRGRSWDGFFDVGDAIGTSGWYWVSDIPQNSNVTYWLVLSYTKLQAEQHWGGDTGSGYSVRLVKDSTSLTDGQSGTYVGNDGYIYPTICIGTQEWVADNLRETKFNTGADIPTLTVDADWSSNRSGAKCIYWNNPAYL